MALDVKNPSVSLFGFHLSHDLSQPLGILRDDANQIWAEVAQLGQRLQSPQLAGLTDLIKSHPNNQKNNQEQENLEKQLIPLLGTDPVKTQIENCLLELIARPYQINDSYAIDITLESKRNRPWGAYAAIVSCSWT